MSRAVPIVDAESEQRNLMPAETVVVNGSAARPDIADWACRLAEAAPSLTATQRGRLAALVKAQPTRRAKSVG